MLRTEIFINNTRVDITEEIAQSLNYAIADIRTPDKRNTSFSKTINIPGSKGNNALFSHIFDISKEALSTNSFVNFSPDFNPNLKASCIIYADGLQQFRGVVQLLQINLRNDSGLSIYEHIEYEVCVYGSLKNLFLEVDSMLLTDLDFSEFNHAFTKANQKSSWATSIKKNGVDYVNFDSIAGPQHTGTVISNNWFRHNGGTTDIAIGDKVQIEGTASSNGFYFVTAMVPEKSFLTTVSWRVFLNTTSLTVGNTGTIKKVTIGQPKGEGYIYPLIDYGYRQQVNEFEVIHLYPGIYVKTYWDKIFQAAGLTYTGDIINSGLFKRLIIPASGEPVKLSQVDIDSRKFSAKFSTDEVLPGSFNLGDVLLVFDDEVSDVNNVYNNTSGKYTVNKSGNYNLSLDIKITLQALAGVKGYLSFAMYIQDQNGANVGSTPVLGPYQSGIGTTTLYDQTWTVPNMYLEKGWTVHVVMLYRALSLTIHNETAFSNNPVSAPVIEGDTMMLSSVVPREVKAKDLLLSLIKMFNLYVDQDPNSDTNLLISPRNEFYLNNQVVDWTKKLDLSKEITIKPVSEIDGREYLFTYKADKDYYNQTYSDKWGKIYGQKNKTIINDFVKGQVKFELIFSPTPSVGNNFNDMVIPAIVKYDDLGQKSPHIGNVRILYYGGVINVSAGGNWKYISNDNTETPFVLNGTTQYYYTTETSYPYCGHLDHPKTPNFDLLFETPSEIFWGGSSGIGASYTNNNLYNIYYKQFIEEITDKDSKIVTAYFKLTPVDIFNLNFKNFIHVDGTNFRLNKIIDYNPTSESTTKVELAKLKQGISFTPSIVDTVGTPSDPRNFTIIEGSLNEVQAPFPPTPYQILEGGLNEVRNPGATNPELIIDGGIS